MERPAIGTLLPRGPSVPKKGWYPGRSVDSAMSFETKLDHLHEFGLAMQVTPGGMLGNTFVKGYQGDDRGGPRGKTAYPQHKGKKKEKRAKLHQKHGVAASGNVAMGGLSFNMQNVEQCTLLGIPSSDYEEAEARLLKRLKQLGINHPSSRSISAVDKRPLAAPLVKNPISPNPNPNATNAGADSPYLGDILGFLRKKKNPSGPLG
jgi:hypothetical protein